MVTIRSDLSISFKIALSNVVLPVDVPPAIMIFFFCFVAVAMKEVVLLLRTS